jgi:hypothetical protein
MLHYNKKDPDKKNCHFSLLLMLIAIVASTSFLLFNDPNIKAEVFIYKKCYYTY